MRRYFIGRRVSKVHFEPQKPTTLEEYRMSQDQNQNPNQKPGQQQQGNPPSQPGQQQQGGGQKPGQQQQGQDKPGQQAQKS